MMKNLNIKIWAGAMAIILLVSSCDDFLDINTNPNAATTADVQLVLPHAIVATANLSNQFNTYGSHLVGYRANAGGFSGFGILLSYNFTPADYNGMWTNTYQDPLRDLKYVIDNTEGSDQLSYFNAAAKIMTVFNYMKLVDAFGDIPYTEALRGEEGIVTPAYEDAAAIYTDLIATCDEAIAQIDDAEFPLSLTTASDPLFGDVAVADRMLAWQRFANTLKLKMLVRTSTPGNARAEFATLDLALGFLTDDAIVDPGYELNRPNPTWATWGRTIAGALSNSAWVPTTFSISFYNGTKILDPGRGKTTFVDFPNTPHNQLGNEVGNPPIVAGQVTWQGRNLASDTLNNGNAAIDYSTVGVLKGPAMGQPLMLLAESKFLQAEAQLHTYIAGSFTTTYYQGITASFAYSYKDQNESIVQPESNIQSKPVTIDSLVESYISDNDGNRLVEIEAAGTVPQRVEAIITQKYIAMNMITSDESYNEFRRTGFPVTVPGGAPALDIASNKSTITQRFDRLPTRAMYPSSEQSFNSSHYRDVDYRSERIFWDPN
jgi:hypothetical protein